MKTVHRFLPQVLQIFVAVLFVVAAHLLTQGATSNDLVSVWMAGQAYSSNGELPVYRIGAANFDVVPPIQWLEHLNDAGHIGNIYPFVYPPIWAYISSLLGQILTLPEWKFSASVVNPALIFLTVLRARSIAAPAMNKMVYLGIGLTMSLFTLPGRIALEENQPQILLAFLTVYAIERANNKKQKIGGIALGIAAAIKIFPGFLGIFWVVERNWRAFGGCLVAAGVLATASVMIAGWSLHEEYLDVLGSISRTVVITPFAWSIDNLISNLFLQEQMIQLRTPGLVDGAQINFIWYILEKSATWRLVSGAALLFALVVLLLIYRSVLTSPTRGFFWPGAIIVLSLISPVGWAYYYLAPLAFVPALFARFSLLGAAIIVILVLLTMSPWNLLPFNHYITGNIIPSIFTLSMLAGMFFRASLPPKSVTERKEPPY